jgi:hypothetical protein
VKLAGLAGALDDALNPIVVKELRQAVKSRFVVAALALFLVVEVALLGFLLLTSDLGHGANALETRAGRQMFTVLQGILLFTCMVFVPVYTAVRLAAERSDTNVDLLFISTLPPRSIIWGKFFAAIVLVLLIFSACAPFMTFTYLLRGIDIPSILLVLAIDFLAVMGGTQLVILLAAVPTTRFLKGVLLLLGFTFLLILLWMTIAGTVSLLEFGAGLPLDTLDFWSGVIGVTTAFLAILGLLFCWSVAIVSPPTANRALSVRLCMLGLWVLTGAIFAIWGFVMKSEGPIAVWTAFSVALFCWEMVLAINEREHWSPRVARTIPRRWWLRLPAFFFYSGSAGGVAFSAVMIGLTLLAMAAWALAAGPFFPTGRRPPDLEAFAEILAAMGLYTFCYAMTAVWIRNLVPGGRIRPIQTWAVLLALVGVGSITPYLVLFLLDLQSVRFQNDALWTISNPFVSVMWVADSRGRSTFNWGAETILPFVEIWAIVMMAVNFRWFLRQVRQFRPYQGGAPRHA